MKFFLPLLLLTIVAQAGVQTVGKGGKGGGYAEMQLILLNARMLSLVQPCVSHSDSCGLRAEEKKLVELSASPAMTISVQASCLPAPIRVVSAEQAEVTSCSLYQAQDGPNTGPAKSFREIAASALTARLMVFGRLNYDSSIAIAEKVFANFSEDEVSVSVAVPEGDIVFHSLKYSDGRQTTSIFSLEGRRTSVDISAQVAAAVKCEQGSPPSFGEIAIVNSRILDDGSGLIESSLVWSCAGGQYFEGTLQVFFKPRPSKSIATASAQGS